MNKQPPDQDYVEMSDRTYQKGFQAFKHGIDGAPARKNKPYLLAGLALAGAAIVAMLLFVSVTGAPNPIGQADQLIIIGDENEDEAEVPASLEDVEIDTEWALELIPRGTYDYSVTKTESLHHGEFTVSLSTDWNIREENIKDGTKTTFTGPNSEELSVVIFDHLSSKDTVMQEAENLLSEHPYTSATRLPYENLVKYIVNTEIGQRHDRLGFTIDQHSWFYSFENQETDRFYDLFASELFGKKILLFADYPLDQPETWAQTYHFMSKIIPKAYQPYVLEVSEEVSKDGRPLEKEMVTTVQLDEYVSEAFKLYQNEELRFSTYIPKESEINEFVHKDFTEWRVSLDTTDKQFYSFGLLHSKLELNQVEDFLIDTYGITFDAIEKANDETITFDDPINKISGVLKLYSIHNKTYFMYEQIDSTSTQQFGEWPSAQLARYFFNEIQWQ
ncbi:hypothetical protein NSQ54_05635 [Alkalihalobacillus sp. FSL W8-0930]